ncbi:MAG: flagellar brake domain-containing protein [Planctomycetota bacterium]
MALWNPLTPDAPSEKTLRLIRQMVSECVVLELFQLDRNDKVVDAGKCRFLDYRESDHQLIVDIPTRNGQPMQIGVDENARISVDLNGNLFKFETTVLERMIYKPQRSGSCPALVLRGPRELQSGNRRRHYRVEPMIKMLPTVRFRPAVPENASKNIFPWQPADLRDISCRGLGIVVGKVFGERLRVGHKLEIAVRFEGSTQDFIANATVRRIVGLKEPDKTEADRFLFGMEFFVPGDDPDACIEQLANFVAECQREIAKARRDNG